jgi:tRNA threonylcarbamoyladenosine biosynthesis protein TsaE
MQRNKIIKQCPDINATNELGNILGQNLIGGEIIELRSDLGGGKTALVKAIVKGASSEDLVSSPSFTICNQYRAKDLTIYHYDFYRLSDPGIMKQELEENILDDSAVIIIEWPDLVEGVLPVDRLSIDIEVTSENSRQFKLLYTAKLDYIVEGI